MPLFHVQDDDHSAYVFATDFAGAIKKWITAVKKENDAEDESDSEWQPVGVVFLAPDNEIIFEDDFIEPFCSGGEELFGEDGESL